MSHFHWIAELSLALIWLSRVIDAGLGMRTRRHFATEWDRMPDAINNSVAIIVPARNEEASVEQALQRLISLDYEHYQVIAVDDRSTDRTGEIMDTGASTSDGKVDVVHIRQLPPGWLGKTHAM
jgi:cellulose synthase/poly-beta-1,6-N-acetylglucosamine synthase-like glycosyltransferase